MNLSSAEIESVVRSVLARLTASAAPTTTDIAKIDDANQAIQIKEKLITVELLKSHASTIAQDGSKTIEFSSRAIVTPAAIDWLKERKLVWTRRAKDLKTGSSPKPPAMGLFGRVELVGRLQGIVCPRQATVESNTSDDATSLRDAQRLMRAQYRVGILVVDAPHAACWQAARDDFLRPAVLSDWNQLQNILREVPANLLILDAKQWRVPAIANVVKQWHQALVAGGLK